MTNEVLVLKSCDAKHGAYVNATSFEDGTIVVSGGSRAISFNVHMTREQAGQLIRILEEVVAVYDAANPSADTCQACVAGHDVGCTVPDQECPANGGKS